MFSVRFFVSQLQIIIITESDFNVLKTEMYLQVLVIIIIGQRSRMGLRWKDKRQEIYRKKRKKERKKKKKRTRKVILMNALYKSGIFNVMLKYTYISLCESMCKAKQKKKAWSLRPSRIRCQCDNDSRQGKFQSLQW